MANQNAHNDAVALAEGARQISKKANNTASGHHAADITFYRAVLASGRTNGVSTGALAALHTLGDATAEYGQTGDM